MECCISVLMVVGRKRSLVFAVRLLSSLSWPGRKITHYITVVS